jgi:hypothetical protein
MEWLPIAIAIAIIKHKAYLDWLVKYTCTD